MINIVRVPQGLKELVGKAQCQNILDGFLAQVVIDPEHGIGREDGLHNLVQCPGRGQVVAKGFLNDNPAPALILGLSQAVLGELTAHQFKGLGGDGQVKRVVAPCAPGFIELS